MTKFIKLTFLSEYFPDKKTISFIIPEKIEMIFITDNGQTSIIIMFKETYSNYITEESPEEILALINAPTISPNACEHDWQIVMSQNKMVCTRCEKEIQGHMPACEHLWGTRGGTKGYPMDDATKICVRCGLEPTTC